MSVTFLAPLFLAGLAAIAIPILIHLTHRERRDVIPFPSLMFLRRVPYRTVRRQRIRHWLLFLLRAAAVILAVVAFARPLLDRASLGPVILGSAREVVILIDRSYSMGYGDRWSRALNAARRTIDGPGRDHRATVVFFSDLAEAVNQPSADQAALHALIDRAQLGAGRTRYDPAVQLARDVLEVSDLPRREAVLITDFQKIGWDGQQDLRLPEGTVLTWIDLSDAEPTNIAVTDILLDRTQPSGRGRATVSARVVNTGATPVSDLSVALAIDGQDVQTRTIELLPEASVMVRFAPVAVPERVMRGRVRVPSDPLPQDDAFHFTLAPLRAVPLLIVRHPSARAREALYLRRALGIGRDPPFDVEVKRVDRLQPDDLDDRAIVILNDAPYPTGGSGQRLLRFVRDGGGLLVVLGQRSEAGTWPAAATDLFIARPGVMIDRLGARGGTVSILDYSHPIFEPFGAPRSGDFSAARFFRYRRYESPPSASILARFDDGAVALAETRTGMGRVMVWTTDLANRWNDLPVQPVFLPFVHEVARYLADYREAPAWYTVGQALDLAANPAARPWGPPSLLPRTDRSVELVVETPSGNRLVKALGESGGHVELRELGFYTIRPLGEDAEAARVVAVNPDVAESDLTRLDPEELALAVEPRESGSDRATALAVALTPAEKERRQGLWWYLLLAVVLILLAEAAVAGRLSGTTR